MCNFFQLVAALAAAAMVAGQGLAPSPVCLKGQPRTQSEPHSGTVIANALRNMVSTSTHGICSGVFPAHGAKTRRSSGSLVLQATRDSQKASLSSSCAVAFTSIINSCIESLDYYGGNVTVGQIHYAVFNDRYPAPWLSTKSSAHSHALPKSTPSGHSVPTRPIPPPHPSLLPTSTLPAKGSAPLPLPVSSKSHIFAAAASSPTKKPPHATSSAAGSGIGAAAAAGAAVGGAAAGVVAVGGVAAGGAAAAGEAAAAAGGDAGSIVRPNKSALSPTLSSQSKSRSSSISSSSSVSPSASPSPSVSNWIIIPKTTTGGATDGVGAELKATFGTAGLFTLSDPDGGVEYWGASLNPSQVKLFLANPAVATVIPDALKGIDGSPQASTSPAPSRRSPSSFRNESSLLQKRDDLVVETGQGWDLRDISYPPRATFDTDSYVYDAPAGKGVTVYVVSTGANPLHADFTGMDQAQSVRWLYPRGEARSIYEANTESDELNTGTCMVSKAVGHLYGVAKRANLVVVKLPLISGLAGRLYISDLLASLNAITRDVVSKLQVMRTGPPSVAVLSWNIPQKDLTESEKRLFVNQFNLLQKVGVVVVVPAGDDAPTHNSPISQFPAAMGRELAVIVIGGVASDGRNSVTSQVGPSLAAFAAPGVLLECASNVGTTGSQIKSSTPNAAAMAAGLAAYFMSIPEYFTYIYGDGSQTAENNLRNRPAKVYALMGSLAYKRGAGTMPVIWNGVNWAEDAGSSCEAESE